MAPNFLKREKNVSCLAQILLAVLVPSPPSDVHAKSRYAEYEITGSFLSSRCRKLQRNITRSGFETAAKRPCTQTILPYTETQTSYLSAALLLLNEHHFLSKGEGSLINTSVKSTEAYAVYFPSILTPSWSRSDRVI